MLDVSDLGGNPDSNTLLSDMTTVICLDDYHCLDRYGRKDKVPLATTYLHCSVLQAHC
jgi:hypothetical protein